MTETTALRVGTRASRLARTQSGQVADALAAALGREVELVDVSTQGDTSSAPLASFGGVGVFVSALRDALLRGEVDIAVHSLKDLPTAPHDGITLAAVPQREDPRDVVVARERVTDQDRGIGRIAIGLVRDLDRRERAPAVERERPGQRDLAVEAEALFPVRPELVEGPHLLLPE